jgi:hypothetical protein
MKVGDFVKVKKDSDIYSKLTSDKFGKITRVLLSDSYPFEMDGFSLFREDELVKIGKMEYFYLKIRE